MDDYDEVLTFKKKTTNKNKKKKTKSFEEIQLERAEKKRIDEQKKIKEMEKINNEKKTQEEELKKNEQACQDFELDLLKSEFDEKILIENSTNLEKNSNKDSDKKEFDDTYEFI